MQQKKFPGKCCNCGLCGHKRQDCRKKAKEESGHAAKSEIAFTGIECMSVNELTCDSDEFWDDFETAENAEGDSDALNHLTFFEENMVHLTEDDDACFAMHETEKHEESDEESALPELEQRDSISDDETTIPDSEDVRDLAEETVNCHVDGNCHRREQEEENAEMNEKSKSACVSSAKADQHDDVARERKKLKSAENAWEACVNNESRTSAKCLIMGIGSDSERQHGNDESDNI